MRPFAIITGGTSGIGYATARKMAANYDLLLVYRNAHDRARDAVAELRKQQPQGKFEILACDLATGPGATQVVEFAKKEFARPTRVLINAAGHTSVRLFIQSDQDYNEDLIQTHLLGPIRLTRLILPDMYREKFGRIINLSSIAVLFGGTGRGHLAYATAKAGIEAFTTGLAKEVGHRNITVNAIRPGLVQTDMIQDIKIENDLDRARLIPADHVADLALYLLSPSANQINGSIMMIDPNLPITPLTIKSYV